MRRKRIELAFKDKNTKKKYREEIFMPQFFLNLINLTKKAEKLRKKLNQPINQELILDFKTSFSHMPKINFLSCKSNNDNETINKVESTKIKYISLFNNPERVIVRPSLPKINDKSHSISFDSKDKNTKNHKKHFININTNNNKNIFYKKDSSLKVFSIKIKKNQIKLNRNKSYVNINFNKNKNLLSNFSFPSKNKYNKNYSHINIDSSKNNFSMSYNNNKEQSQIKTEKENINSNLNSNSSNNIKPIYININRKNTNLFINNYIEAYVKNKFKNKKSDIVDKTPKESQKNNTNGNIKSTKLNINELYLQKETKKKIISINFNKTTGINLNSNNNYNYNSNNTNSNPINNPTLKKTSALPIYFKTKEDLLNSYLDSPMKDYSLIFNNSLNSGSNIYYFNISKMYRKQMIDYMKHRINWKHIDYSTLNNMNNSQKNNNININFEWKYYSNRLNYKKYKYSANIPNKKLRMINLFEKNYEIGNKKNMFLNLISYCDKIKYNIFDIVPFTMIISNSKDFEYATNSLKEIIEFLENNKNTQNNLIINKLYREQFWYDKNFDNLNNQIIYFNKNFISDKNHWILKPTDMYQGKYIEISNTYDDVCKKCLNMFKGVNSNLGKEIMEIEEENQKNENNLTNINNSENNNNTININTNNNFRKKIIIKKNAISKMYCCSDIIIQKYLDNPLLYKKRKFDIRCFALLDSNLNLYYCKEGHLKGSSELYNVENTNKFIHITNYSFQKKSSSFAKYEYGNEISYDSFKQFLEEEGFPPDKFNTMIEDMKFLIKISFKSVSQKIYKTSEVLCFELFGYDFIIDNEFKPWILEINNNPGLGISSPVIKKIIPRMLDDAFRLTIDKVFDTRYDESCFDENGKYKSRFPIDGYRDDENLFEFLCNIK